VWVAGSQRTAVWLGVSALLWLSVAGNQCTAVWLGVSAHVSATPHHYTITQITSLI